MYNMTIFILMYSKIVHEEMDNMYEDLLYSRLSQLRNKKGVSAREMSLSIGQNHGYINGIENKCFLPSVTELFYICEYLNVTPKEFFDDDTKNPVKLNSIINNLKKLDDEQLGNVEAIIKGLIR